MRAPSELLVAHTHRRWTTDLRRASSLFPHPSVTHSTVMDSEMSVVRDADSCASSLMRECLRRNLQEMGL